MKSFRKIMAVLLSILLMLSLAACNTEPQEETTAPTETTAAPTEPDALDLYENACAVLNSQNNVVIRFDYSHERSVSGESYLEHSTGSAYYMNLQEGDLEALVSEEISFSGYETAYIRSYLNGTAYCRANNCSYTCDLTAEEFVAQQMPFVLLDAALYGSVERTVNEDGTYILSFTQPIGAETWAAGEEAQLKSAYGSATFSSADVMTGASYHVEYTVGNVVNTLEVTYEIEMPTFINFSSYQPVYPEECPTVSDLAIPRMMLQVVGDLYATANITASYTDVLYSAAFAAIRSQTGSFDTWGDGEDFMCTMDTQVTVTDYAGTSTANSQSITFQDGVYSYSTNGGEIQESDGVTAEQVRINCEDAILSSLFEFDHIQSATLTDNGDFLCIKFNGSETYTESLCDSIYAMFSMDLDAYADSYTTESSGGYLYINKYTGLPTAIGMYLERTHTIAGAAYTLNYQLDQAMELPSGSSYMNITGEPEPADLSDGTATPLFYKVTGKDGQTLWLLGTIHAGDGRTGNLPDEIMEAFSSADALAVEFDTAAFEESLASDVSLLGSVMEAYCYADGGKYTDHLTKAVRAELKQLIYASGQNSSAATSIKVGIWNSMIENFYMQQSSDLSADLGMDSRLLSWASQQNKKVYEIESGLSQLQMLSGFSDDLQVMLLEDTLELGLIGYGEGLQELYELWCQGDEEALTAYLASDTSDMTKAEKALYKEYNKAMITDRNKVMLKAAKKYLKSGDTVFYAVGLGHLLGENGLVQSLRDAGYTVELVTYE